MAIKRFKKHLPVAMALVLGSSFAIFAEENENVEVSAQYITELQSDDSMYSISPISDSDVPEHYQYYTYDEDYYALYEIEAIDTYVKLITSVYISENQGADVDGNNLWATEATLNAYKATVEPEITTIINALKRIEAANNLYDKSIYVGTFDESHAGPVDDDEALSNYPTNPDGHTNESATSTYAQVLMELTEHISDAYEELHNLSIPTNAFYSKTAVSNGTGETMLVAMLYLQQK